MGSVPACLMTAASAARCWHERGSAGESWAACPRASSGWQAQRGGAMSALEVDGITVRFAGVTALDAVSFTVAPRAIHAVIGPNGAGKSTLFNVLSGAYRPARGSVRFRDVDLTHRAPYEITGLGVARTFQNIALSGAATVEARSEEHTSELQSQSNLVCRLLLEKPSVHDCGTPRS